MKKNTIQLYTRGAKQIVEVINPEPNVWYDAAKYAPNKNSKYLAILESTSPVRDQQTWAGMGEPEVVSYNDNYDTSKIGVNWNSRGTLTVAFWMVLPKFEWKWEKGIIGKGQWVPDED